MLKPFLLLLGCSLLLAQLGCGDDTPSDPSDTEPCDQGSAPSVVQYAGAGEFGGMNFSGVCDTMGERPIILDGPIAFDLQEAPVAYFDSSLLPDDTVTIIAFMTFARDILPEHPSSISRSLPVDVRLRVPGDTTGVFVWTEGGPTELTIRFSIDSASVTYDKIISAKITITRYERISGNRKVAGEFEAILESPDGKRLAVRGKFDAN